MNNHLSQDQMSRWILGQSSPEEEEHGRDCPKCSAELIEFRRTVSTFQDVMKNWSEREVVPKLEANQNALSWHRWFLLPSLRWALVGATVAVLVIVPIYRQPEPEVGGEAAVLTQAEQAEEDVLLMQEVTEHLSRPLPMPMVRVMALLPGEDAAILAQPQVPSGEEVR